MKLVNEDNRYKGTSNQEKKSYISALSHNLYHITQIQAYNIDKIKRNKVFFWVILRITIINNNR